MMYRKYFKRLLDILLSALASIILLPVIMIISLIIKLDSKGPILFKQKRIGANNSTFVILKFRTMRIEAPSDKPTHLLDNSDYWITPIGKVLRKSSLDELPQLYNIIKGEMSIVGPRPALWNQSDLLEFRNKNASFLLKPGLTGWAQVNGRDELTVEEKSAFDGEYFNNTSLRMDIICIVKTFFNVIQSRSIVEGLNGNNLKGSEKSSFQGNKLTK